MKKKNLILIITALVLVAAIGGGIGWHIGRSAPAEPEPLDDVVAVNAEVDEPEPKVEVPEEAPEAEEDHFGEIFYNEETGEFEFVDGSGSVAAALGLEDKTEEQPADPETGEQPETADQQPEDDQQQTGDTGEFSQEQWERWEELKKKLEESGAHFHDGPMPTIDDGIKTPREDLDLGYLIHW